MGDHTAFFYGTLMSPAILHRVIYGTPKPDPWQVERLTIHPALLPGYKRHRVRWADYPAITPYDALPTGANDGVRGTVVTGLADCDIARLEAFEGSQYERRPVTIKVLEGQGEGKELQAETFVWTAGVKLLDPKEWDFKHFMRERSRAWIGAEREDYEDADNLEEEKQTEEEGQVTPEERFQDARKATKEALKSAV